MYPRLTNHCVSHYIPQNIVNSDIEEGEENKDIALKYLRSIGADLIKGDLVIFDAIEGYRNEGVTIFDGENIVELDFELDEYGALPNNFRVIEANVPVTYWSHSDELRGIQHNNIVWFNPSLVKEQVISNVQYGMVSDGRYGIYTTFMYNNIPYRIFYDYGNHVSAEWLNTDTFEINDNNVISRIINKFIEILNSENELPFESEDIGAGYSEENSIYFNHDNNDLALDDNLLQHIIYTFPDIQNA